MRRTSMRLCGGGMRCGADRPIIGHETFTLDDSLEGDGMVRHFQMPGGAQTMTCFTARLATSVLLSSPGGTVSW